MRYGYDIGGAEYPLDPEHLTVVDIIQPRAEDGRVDTEADYVRRDLNSPNWTYGLKGRPVIYVGKVLRYVENSRLYELGADFDKILTAPGIITIFDWLSAIEPISMHLQLKRGYRVVETELINPSEDSEDEYQVIFAKV
jgi:hypothetical protein